ncbi:MAG: carbohydrate-binding family 9-like protein [Cyclobacteriaceae bacterium]|nr:carbohydrate-binding family 9-like protein [Cyclobacteriaceae bacterium]
MNTFNLLFGLVSLFYSKNIQIDNMNSEKENLIVKHCNDFDLNGKGDNPQWNLAEWTQMALRDEAEDKYETKFKILYSGSGIYVLAFCEDKLISTEYVNDQDDIWESDVFEVFLHTDPSDPLYFEYEINPLNTELVLLIPNNDGDFMGWAPWHYEGDRKIKRAVHVLNGKAEPGAKISGWTAEMFFPYALFKGLKNVPPKPGTEWKGNFYRMDYDTGKRLSWSWAPVEGSFHEYEKFWPIVFK